MKISDCFAQAEAQVRQCSVSRSLQLRHSQNLDQMGMAIFGMIQKRNANFRTWFWPSSINRGFKQATSKDNALGLFFYW